MARIQDQLRTSEAEGVEQEARVKLMEGSASETDSKASVKEPAALTSGDDPNTTKRCSAGSLPLRGTRTRLMSKYRPGNVLVKLTQTQIEDLETERKELEKKHPNLPAAAAPSTDKAGAPVTNDLATEKGRLAAMNARTEC